MAESRIILAFLVIAILLGGCGREKPKPVANQIVEVESAAAPLSDLQKLVSSEEIILELGSRLNPLGRSTKNLRLPCGAAVSLFDANLQVADLTQIENTQSVNGYLRRDEWAIGSLTSMPEPEFWLAFLDDVAYFETAKFYFIEANLQSDNQVLDSIIGFSSHVRLKDGQFASASGKINVVWNLDRSNYLDSKITTWDTKEFNCVRSREKLFADVTSDVISDKALANELAESEQDNLTRRLLLKQSVKCPPDDKYRAMFSEVSLEHPAVAIVDFDGDGFDDFFLARRYRPSLMFRNQGDGTFKEVGEETGLRFSYDCVSSLFADFDNDGDQDAFIGRSRHRAVFMLNEDGKFSDRSELVADIDLPFMVSSICAADYNNDGLLDVYFSTYSPIEGSHMALLQNGLRWPNFFMDPVARKEYYRRLKLETPYVDVAGPPNLLLQNNGNGFSKAKLNPEVESWRKSFQSTWCDFDQDGDQDLYVCNDFAPDDLYRNDDGNGFVRVSDELGLDRLGFGMGVSFQDHNNDGHFDLYVSNMYSKAGTRITKQIKGLDQRLSQMADGNYLYEFDGSNFELISLDGPNDTVSKTGWSWGGQMTDFDNDGFVDIVVSNGYYSAPREVEIKVDL